MPIDRMSSAIGHFEVEDSETIRDAIYLAYVLIHRDKTILDPFEGNLSYDRLNKVFAGLTCEELTE